MKLSPMQPFTMAQMVLSWASIYGNESFLFRACQSQSDVLCSLNTRSARICLFRCYLRLCMYRAIFIKIYYHRTLQDLTLSGPNSVDYRKYVRLSDSQCIIGDRRWSCSCVYTPWTSMGKWRCSNTLLDLGSRWIRVASFKLRPL